MIIFEAMLISILEFSLIVGLPVLAIVFCVKYLPKKLLLSVGVCVGLLGVDVPLFLNWEYSESRTEQINVAFPLDRPNDFKPPPFVANFTDRYGINLEFDRHFPNDDFMCLVGSELIPEACFGHRPELDISWKVIDSSTIVASGTCGLQNWQQDQPKINTSEAQHLQEYFLEHKKDHPASSRFSTVFEYVGGFQTVAGHKYQIEIFIRQRAAILSGLHPRLTVAMEAKGTNDGIQFALMFLFLDLLIGGFVLVIAGTLKKT